EEMESVKRKEDELEAAKERTQKIIDAFPYPIFWKDKRSVYIGCNSLFSTLAGVDSPSDIVGKNDHDLPWKSEADLHVQEDTEVMNNNAPRINREKPWIDSTGGTVLRSTSRVPIVNEEGVVFGILGFLGEINGGKSEEEGA
ncbi:MAG: hypothetical protein AAGJ35_10440, partial [Myxococcota bacterium]